MNKKFTFIILLLAFSIALFHNACQMPTPSDGKPNLMSVVINDTLRNLSNVGGGTSFDAEWYGGHLGTKELYIYINKADLSRRNDTSWFLNNTPGYTFVQFDSIYGRKNYGLIAITRRTNSENSIRVEGSFFFDIITQQETLRFTSGHLNTYLKGFD